MMGRHLKGAEKRHTPREDKLGITAPTLLELSSKLKTFCLFTFHLPIYVLQIIVVDSGDTSI